LKKQFLFFILLVLLLTGCWGLPKKSLRVYTVATVLDSRPTLVHSSVGKFSNWHSVVKYQTDSLHTLYGTLSLDEGSAVVKKLCKDEKFVLLYDKSNPSKYIVYYDKPVFLDNEPYVETIGTIVRKSPLVWDNGIEFSYMVKDTTYTKFQEIGAIIGEKSMRRQFPDLKKGDQYKVKYSPNNPQRAVIYLK